MVNATLPHTGGPSTSTPLGSISRSAPNLRVTPAYMGLAGPPELTSLVLAPGGLGLAECWLLEPPVGVMTGRALTVLLPFNTRQEVLNRLSPRCRRGDAEVARLFNPLWTSP